MKGEELRKMGVKLAKQGNYVEAAEMMDQAIKLGNTLALNELGVIMERNDLHKEAFDYYMNASKCGVGIGSRNAGNLLRRGIGVKKNEAKAIEMLELAIKQGNILAYIDLYKIYAYSKKLKNIKLARKCLKKGARLERKSIDMEACTITLAYNFENGVFEKKSIRNTFRTLKLTYKPGKTECAYNLGLCYLFGKGTKVDEKKGIELLEEALEGGYDDAAYRLARYYEEKGKDDYRSLIIHYVGEGLQLHSKKTAFMYSRLCLSGVYKDDKRFEATTCIKTLKTLYKEIHERPADEAKEDLEYYDFLKKEYKDVIDWNLVEKDEENRKETVKH